VKPGYARNFLLPQGKAMLATAGRVQELEHQKRMVAARQAKTLADLEAVKARLSSSVLEFTAQAGEEGKLFGSITSQQIAEQLSRMGFVIDRRKVMLDEPIKSVGTHVVSVRLRGELSADVKVVVSATE
jgi:large subunit ribosomal protein L9